jgi:hypothetical protein
MLKKYIAIFQILFCSAFITWLFILGELRLALFALIFSSWIVGDLLKNWNK